MKKYIRVKLFLLSIVLISAKVESPKRLSQKLDDDRDWTRSPSSSRIAHSRKIDLILTLS